MVRRGGRAGYPERHVQPLPFDKTSGYANMAWLPNGRMVALRIGMRSTLWRFVPTQE